MIKFGVKNRTMARKPLFGLMLAITTLLAGCASFGFGDEDTRRLAEAARENNPGPCPRAFTLYETSRLVQLKGGERYENVGFTGEIEKVRSLCRYYGTAPIDANLTVNMNFGRGPAAIESTHTYYYFVAVTRKNIDVIAKEYYPVTVTFPPGVKEVSVTETIDSIIIPRAAENTSGVNFEIITGFDLTPSQLEFNAAGKRFRASNTG